MAEKIKGVAVQLGNRKWRFSEEGGAPMATEQRATLVIGDERVFTESEVRAILVKITHECGCYEHRGEPVFATRVDDINHIAARHGVVLDPA